MTISLPENPTTGYRWQVPGDDPVLELVGDAFEVASDLRGAPGVRALTFRAGEPGHLRLTLERRRDWERAPVAQFWVDLTIS